MINPVKLGSNTREDDLGVHGMSISENDFYSTKSMPAAPSDTNPCVSLDIDGIISLSEVLVGHII